MKVRNIKNAKLLRKIEINHKCFIFTLDAGLISTFFNRTLFNDFDFVWFKTICAIVLSKRKEILEKIMD